MISLPPNFYMATFTNAIMKYESNYTVKQGTTDKVFFISANTDMH